MNIDSMREQCKNHIENFELWGRRFIDKMLTKEYGSNYLNHILEDGSNLISNKLKTNIVKRMEYTPNTFSRSIDAALIEDIILILSNPKLYDMHFKSALATTYPCGVNHIKHQLNQVIDIRNKISHANPISYRDHEKCICYTNDFIDCLKEYYRQENVFMSYNVPQIVYMRDSLGREIYREQCVQASNGIIWADENFNYDLRPGDEYELEIQIDPTYSDNEYTIKWSIGYSEVSSLENCKSIKIKFNNKHVNNNFSIDCTVISNKDWHRNGFFDDYMSCMFKILPPL